MSALDLTLLSLYRINGQEWPQLPGLVTQLPPKKTARGRDQDRLIIYLTMAGNVMYSSNEYKQIITRISDTFYNTPGSLTYALKSATEALNNLLTERNMASTGKGQYSLGALVLASLRGDSLYLVQCGPTHVFTLGSKPSHLHDSLLSGKGLGLSQTTRMYFAQVQLTAGDRLLFCAALPPNWEKVVSEDNGNTSLENTRRRLMAANDGNISAVLIHASEGKGQFNILKPVIADPILPVSSPPATGTLPPRPAPLPAAPPAGEQDPPSAAPAPALQAAQSTVAQPEPEKFPASAEVAVSPRISAPRPVPVRPPVSIAPRQNESNYSPSPQVPDSSEKKEQLKQGLRHSALLLAQTIQRGRELWHKFINAVENIIPRLLPSEEDEPPSLISRAWPVFIAVLVPILTIVLAIVVYENIGKQKQYELYFTNAKESAAQTQNQSDPAILRKHWSDTIYWLDRADEFKGLQTADSQTLRQMAQDAIDNLDRVTRVNFQPAFNTPLSHNLQITRMTASDTDIYLLDIARGTVLRGQFNGRNYNLDAAFLCGPGTYNGIQIGPLIDIFALPRTNPSTATVVGVDAAGNLLYCIPGSDPHASYLKTPDTGWKTITAIAYDANVLYALDASARAVWVYFGDEKLEFPDKPYYFFESQIPLAMEESIGIAVNGDDLYLLYRDGHMTTCTLSRLTTAPTRCNDPAIFTDTRPGFQSGIYLSDGKFTQIAFTSPPDPSVALLRPYTQSVFRFSARALELQKELRPQPGDQNPLPAGDLSAMAFSPNKSLFVFVNGELYFALNTP